MPACRAFTATRAPLTWLLAFALMVALVPAGTANADGGYVAEVVSVVRPPAVASGSDAEVTVRYRNTGSQTWKPGVVHIATALPRDRISFFHHGAWPWGNRPASVPSEVAPGEAVDITFPLRAGVRQGRYVESFQLVAEGITWFGESSLISLVIEVSGGEPFISLGAEPQRKAGKLTLGELEVVGATVLQGDANVVGTLSVGALQVTSGALVPNLYAARARVADFCTFCPTGGGSAGVSSIARTGSTALTGAVTFSPGANITLTQTGNDIQIAAGAGGYATIQQAGTAVTQRSTFNLLTGLTAVDNGASTRTDIGLDSSVVALLSGAQTLTNKTITDAVQLAVSAPAVNTSPLSVSGYSLTGANAQSLIDLAGTWNTTGTPTAVKLNITDTASNAASSLLDLQVGGTSRFSVRKDGLVGVREASTGYALYVPWQSGDNSGSAYFGSIDSNNARTTITVDSGTGTALLVHGSTRGLPVVDAKSSGGSMAAKFRQIDLSADNSVDNTVQITRQFLGAGLASGNVLEIDDQSNVGSTGNLLVAKRSGTSRFAIDTKGNAAFVPDANTTPISVSGYSLTDANAQSLLDLTGTWNTTGAPTGIKLNITDTASNAASLLMDLQTGGASRFRVTRYGGVVVDPIANTPAGAETRSFNSRGLGLALTASYANQYFNVFGQPYVDSSVARTVTNAATVYIAGPPLTFNSATITNPTALAIASGRIGFGTVAPSTNSILTVIDPGFTNVPTGTATILTLGSSDGATTGNSIRARGTINAAGTDYGEYINFTGSIGDYQQGDLLVNAGKDLASKSTRAYQSELIGVVTTTAAFRGGSDDGLRFDAQGRVVNRVVIALAGRVPVRVTGAVSAGDPLTSSDIPGVAMRATRPGRIVGYAMESGDGGSVLMFLSPGWWDGGLFSGALEQLGTLTRTIAEQQERILALQRDLDALRASWSGGTSSPAPSTSPAVSPSPAPSAQPSASPSSSPSSSPEASPSSSASPSPLPSSSPAASPSPSASSEPAPASSPAASPVPSTSPSPEPTAAPSPSAAPASSSPSPEPTASSSPSSTVAPAPSPLPSASPSPSAP